MKLSFLKVRGCHKIQSDTMVSVNFVTAPLSGCLTINLQVLFTDLQNLQTAGMLPVPWRCTYKHPHPLTPQGIRCRFLFE